MFVPNILLVNVISLTPKVGETPVFSKSMGIDLFLITETWLKSTINDNQVALSRYNLERLDRRIGVHGRACLSFKTDTKTKSKLGSFVSSCETTKNGWSEVKLLSGMDNSLNLKSCIQIENAEYLSLEELTSLMDNSFLEPMEE